MTKQEFEQLIASCPLVPNLTSMSMMERSNFLAEHSVALDEWYHRLKVFKRALVNLEGAEKLKKLRAKTGRQWAWYFYQELGYRIVEDAETELHLKKAMNKILDGVAAE